MKTLLFRSTDVAGSVQKQKVDHLKQATVWRTEVSVDLEIRVRRQWLSRCRSVI